MTIKIIKETEIEINIHFPFFWKNPSTYYNEYVGLLDENTVAKVLLMDNYCTIVNGTPDKMQSELKTAYANFHPCTEVDFLSAYDEALQGMSLQPVEKTLTDSLYDVMGNGKESSGEADQTRRQMQGG